MQIYHVTYSPFQVRADQVDWVFARETLFAVGYQSKLGEACVSLWEAAIAVFRDLAFVPAPTSLRSKHLQRMAVPAGIGSAASEKHVAIALARTEVIPGLQLHFHLIERAYDGFANQRCGW